MHSVFKQRLAEALDRSEATEAQVAANAGISIQALNNYKESRLPKLEQAMALAKALGVSVGWLIGEPQSGAPTIVMPSPNMKRVLLALGNPLPERLSVQIDIPVKRVRDLVSGKAQPSQIEAVKLLDEVSNVAITLAAHLPTPALRPSKITPAQALTGTGE